MDGIKSKEDGEVSLPQIERQPKREKDSFVVHREASLGKLDITCVCV